MKCLPYKAFIVVSVYCVVESTVALFTDRHVSLFFGNDTWKFIITRINIEKSKKLADFSFRLKLSESEGS